MNIQSTIRPQALTQKAAPPTKQEQDPKGSWQDKAGDYLEVSNDVMTPRLAGIGMALKFAAKGNEITESLHPVAKVIGVVGGGALGAVIGHTGGSFVNNIASKVTDTVFGEDTSLSKSVVATGISSVAFGLVGGWTGAVLHGAFTAGGAATLARQDILNQA